MKVDKVIKGIGALMYEGIETNDLDNKQRVVRAIRGFMDYARDDEELTHSQICKIVGYGENAIKKIERGDKE